MMRFNRSQFRWDPMARTMTAEASGLGLGAWASMPGRLNVTSARTGRTEAFAFLRSLRHGEELAGWQYHNPAVGVVLTILND